MSTHEFALKTAMPEDTILSILKQESSVTSEMAILFDKLIIIFRWGVFKCYIHMERYFCL